MRELMRGVPPVRDTGQAAGAGDGRAARSSHPAGLRPGTCNLRAARPSRRRSSSASKALRKAARCLPIPTARRASTANTCRPPTSCMPYSTSPPGNITFGPYFVKSLFQGFGGQCETEDAMSDPTVRFDRAAGRWIIQQIAGEYGFTPPLFICLGGLNHLRCHRRLLPLLPFPMATTFLTIPSSRSGPTPIT